MLTRVGFTVHVLKHNLKYKLRYNNNEQTGKVRPQRQTLLWGLNRVQGDRPRPGILSCCSENSEVTSGFQRQVPPPQIILVSLPTSWHKTSLALPWAGTAKHLSAPVSARLSPSDGARAQSAMFLGSLWNCPGRKVRNKMPLGDLFPWI